VEGGGWGIDFLFWGCCVGFDLLFFPSLFGCHIRSFFFSSQTPSQNRFYLEAKSIIQAKVKIIGSF